LRFNDGDVAFINNCVQDFSAIVGYQRRSILSPPAKRWYEGFGDRSTSGTYNKTCREMNLNLELGLFLVEKRKPLKVRIF